MNQCVPSWDVEDTPTPPRITIRPNSSSNSLATDHVPTLDYEVAELTWENGQLAMHGYGPRRLLIKSAAGGASSPTKYAWDKPRAGGTLESIVNQATRVPNPKSAAELGVAGQTCNELVPWLDHDRPVVNPSAAASVTVTMDALVPCTNNNAAANDQQQREPSSHLLETMPGIGRRMGCSTRVGSCSGAATLDKGMAARVGGIGATVHEWSSRADQSMSGSATCGRDSRQVTLDTCDMEFGAGGFTSTSMGSPGNTSSAKQCTKNGDDHDSVCHSISQRDTDDGDAKAAKRTGKSSVSTKRSRAAAIHNQSERKRRDKINQRMKTLQKLVPNSSKTDKASMLDEVIEYLKQLQAQVQMIRNISPMMMPLAMQQQLQMSMMNQMGMGMGIGMGMGVLDINTIGRANIAAGMSPAAAVLHPSAFMPPPPPTMASWADNPSGDRLHQPTPSSVIPDPLSAFLACQTQPMTMDAYSRIAALYQQFQQQPGPGSKN